MRPHEGGNFDVEVSPRQDSYSLKEEVKNGHFCERKKRLVFKIFWGAAPDPAGGLTAPPPPDPQLVLSRAMHVRLASRDLSLFCIWRPLLTEILDPPVNFTNQTLFNPFACALPVSMWKKCTLTSFCFLAITFCNAKLQIATHIYSERVIHTLSNKTKLINFEG